MILSDSDLIVLIVTKNDHRAFKKLVERYQSDLRGLFLRLTSGNQSIADDLAQETFFRVFRYLKGYNGNSGFKTWLFRIGYNAFYEYINNEKKSVEFISGYKVEDVTIETKSNIDFNTALTVLEQKEKIVIVLFYEKGFTHKEISEIVGQPLGTVKTNILRGKEKLKKFYNYEGSV